VERALFGHSEQSEESLFDFGDCQIKKERFLAALGMTELWFFAARFNATLVDLKRMTLAIRAAALSRES
jgi:hypothetical protein